MAVRAQASAEAVSAAAAHPQDADGGPPLVRILHDVPAAVLMVNVDDGQVTYANPAALALSTVHLPVAAGTWAAEAGLAAAERDTAETALERAARGEPVHGEPVVVPTRDGRRQLLWVTAFPLPPLGGLQRSSLVVLLPVDPGFGVGDASYDVRNRALVAAGLSFTISDPHAEDHPLLWVNPAFTAMTGYAADESVGRNCRFLQGPGTDPEPVRRMRAAIAAEEPAQVVLLNYRKDGTAFWNEVSLSPVFDPLGELTHFVGVQADVTARVEAELQREAHLRAETEARASSERIQARLTVLGDATEALVSTLDVDRALDRLVEVLVPRLADWCVVELVDDSSGAGHGVAAAHVDPALRDSMREVERLQAAHLTDEAPIRQVLRTGEPVLLRELDERSARSYSDTELHQVYARLGMRSAVVVPLKARRQVLGTLALVRAEAGREYGEAELELASDLARRAALIVDNARLYAREHSAAAALQLSLLPDLPEVPGLKVAARYLPSVVGAAVGGDWYDLLQLPDGSAGVAIGDVMGHDMAAAAAMGQLRSVLRSYAWQRQPPGQVLDSLDQLVQALDMAQLATAVFGRIELDEDGTGGVFDYANAGHLPPLVALPDGSVRALDGGWSVLIGAPGAGARRTAREWLPTGSTVVLYTDGLVERRERDVETGLAQLAEALRRACAQGGSVQQVCDALIAELDATSGEDDTALLVVRLVGARAGPPEQPASALEPGVRTILPAEPASAGRARRRLQSALTEVDASAVELALLLTSELISNAVTHGRGELGLRVDITPAVVRVEVDDAGPGLPRRRDPRPDAEPAEGGRGVVILEALAARWGTEALPVGKRVWFELDR